MFILKKQYQINDLKTPNYKRVGKKKRELRAKQAEGKKQ